MCKPIDSMPGEPANARPDGHLSAPILFAAALTLLLIATPAQAHQGTGLAGGFTSGFMHPLTGPDHVLAMVAVGIWGAFLGRPLVYLLPIIFPSAMAFGAGVAMIGIPLPPVEYGIAFSVLVLGGMIMFAARVPIAVACFIVGFFALFHGYSHGAELPSAANPIGYSAGFVLATGLLHVLGIGIGVIKVAPGGIIALRTAGAGIALAGIWFLSTAVMP